MASADTHGRRRTVLNRRQCGCPIASRQPIVGARAPGLPASMAATVIGSQRAGRRQQLGPMRRLKRPHGMVGLIEQAIDFQKTIWTRETILALCNRLPSPKHYLKDYSCPPNRQPSSGPADRGSDPLYHALSALGARAPPHDGARAPSHRLGGRWPAGGGIGTPSQAPRSAIIPGSTVLSHCSCHGALRYPGHLEPSRLLLRAPGILHSTDGGNKT